MAIKPGSFMFIDDCIKGIDMIMHSNVLEPINLGSSELVSINQLVDIAEDIGGVKLQRHYKLDAPKGVRRAKQRQRQDSASTSTGSPIHACATAWPRPTSGSWTSHRKVQCKDRASK